MSLADTIGFALVVLVALFLCALLCIEAFWRLRQRNDYLRAQTMKKRREHGAGSVELIPVEHQILSLPYASFTTDVKFPADKETQEVFADFLDRQFKLARWEFVGFIQDRAIVFRRTLQGENCP